MLRGVVIAPDAALRFGIEDAIAATGHVLLLRSFDRYLSVEEMQGYHRAHAPQVLFLDVATNAEMVAAAGALVKALPGLQVVALGGGCDASLLMRLMHLGLRELLYPPFDKSLFLETLARLRQQARETPAAAQETTDLVYGFLPAKAGCGCSTLAMNAAVAMGRMLEGQVLLADFDINSGIARFLLKLSSGFSVQDALDKAGDLDDGMWQELVARVGALDVLASGQIQRTLRAPQGAVRRLIEFARGRYKGLCLDFSGELEEHCLEALEECRRILLVVQPDLATVYLAREKLRFLRALELEDRVTVLLNRWQRHACLSMADIESVIGLPIQHTIGEDGEVVYKALLGGAPVEPGTELGKELARLAVFLSEAHGDKAEVTPKKRMVEYFSLLPAKYTLFPGQR
ncbi:MAG: hypothetical protein JNK48_16285 [Bryobacterales bacterium]|nr:hypothetical protein [Bryobacterales bacterium]